MKLSQIRPCDNCGGPIGQMFYVLRLSLAFIAPHVFNQVAGLTQVFNGQLGLAEVMAPDADVVKVAGDEDKTLMTELLICSQCYLEKSIDLPMLVERRIAAKEKE